MTEHLTEDDVLAGIPGLTRARLVIYVKTGMVRPLSPESHSASSRIFRRIDFARIQLLCDLTNDLDLDIAALGVVIGLIDQLHAKRQDLLVIASAIAAEPAHVRARIGAAILTAGE